ncbi:MAG: PH domain-containing protein [Pedobacter sp.]|nr:PH domain-containing protein [Pedobacter sp.]
MENFSNEPIDINSLPRYEEVPLNALDPNYWKVIVLNICISILLIGTASGLVFLLKKETTAYIVPVIIAIVVFGAFLFVLFRMSFKRRGLAVREKDIIYSSGILSAKTTIIPFSRIQHVALNEGLFSRMYNLGALEVFTAGGATGNVKIHGLEINLANKIKELLAKRVNNGI